MSKSPNDELDNGAFILDAATNPEVPNKATADSLKAIGTAAVIAAGIAVAQVAATFVEPVAEALKPILPPWLGALLTAAASGAVIWLNSVGRRKTKQGAKEAYNSAPPIRRHFDESEA